MEDTNQEIIYEDLSLFFQEGYDKSRIPEAVFRSAEAAESKLEALFEQYELTDANAVTDRQSCRLLCKLAAFMRDGSNPYRDEKMAFAILETAARFDESSGELCIAMAECLEKGIGVMPDIGKASQWRNKAAYFMPSVQVPSELMCPNCDSKKFTAYHYLYVCDGCNAIMPNHAFRNGNLDIKRLPYDYQWIIKYNNLLKSTESIIEDGLIRVLKTAAGIFHEVMRDISLNLNADMATEAFILTLNSFNDEIIKKFYESKHTLSNLKSGTPENRIETARGIVEVLWRLGDDIVRFFPELAQNDQKDNVLYFWKMGLSFAEILQSVGYQALDADFPERVASYYEKVFGITPPDKTPIDSKKINEEKEQASLSDPLNKLNAMIGLDRVKKEVRTLATLAKNNQRRKEMNLAEITVSKHLVFTGNPGTGKTTVAEILAQIYKNLGVLSKGQTVKATRSELVAGYVGQTAIKTKEKIQQALGGVLFIDEAYTLAKEGNDFGQEAIDTLLTEMEEHRDDLVVIVAGYPELMKKFINSNPGLKSRFSTYIPFEDYSEEELYEIFQSFCRSSDLKLSPKADRALKNILSDLVRNKDANFANARDIRNIFEKVCTNQSIRLDVLDKPTKEDMILIVEADLKNIG